MKIENVLLTIIICVVALGGGLLIMYMLANGSNACINCGQGYRFQQSPVFVQQAPIVQQVPLVIVSQSSPLVYNVQEKPVTTTTLAPTPTTLPCQNTAGYRQPCYDYGYDYNRYGYYDYRYGYYDGSEEDYYNYKRYNDNNNDNEYDLTVAVRDEDGDPIEGAYVRVQDGDEDSANTDPQGVADFNNLEEDSYEIRVSKSGYETYYKDIDLEDDETVYVHLKDN